MAIEVYNFIEPLTSLMGRPDEVVAQMEDSLDSPNSLDVESPQRVSWADAMDQEDIELAAQPKTQGVTMRESPRAPRTS